MNTVLIAHYNKDIRWLSKLRLNLNIVVYSTSDKSKIFVPNKEMDSSMYLKYIIDNYDKLPERTLFCHHHEEDWTQDLPLPIIINNLN